MGGVVGLILTGFLAKNSIITLADPSVPGGAIDGNVELIFYYKINLK
jgi:ammonia channel protein AmtB